ncbi:NADP-dependent oxidoreductase [Leptolyngbya sp. 7M]|uniref:NADP-dependent oxidoreductase n=1 Tax=Leptolyngbya sp. 7M TaxID=2812896 RepID=UPI001B8DA911|nr:NADP-dependent oxidoreductase [Leptolyngbya sp. 7M]QYO64518.1 NADP-dependent oxidoreductase [Leptolyngbya sp. 7M]
MSQSPQPLNGTLSKTDTMKAIRIHAYGGVENLQYDEVLRPEPQAGEVLVQVYAAGINPIDWKIREGYLKQAFNYALPVIVGTDLAGIVAEVGEGVTTLQPGQAVYGVADMTRSGSYAEYAVGYAEATAPKPEMLDFIHAASVPIAAMTAWQALFDGANLQTGQTVLIHGAAGGVGSYAIQFAKWKGATVIATASAVNADYVKGLGADQVIDYAAQPFEQQVKPVDVVLDLVGGDTQVRSWQILRSGGVLASTLGVPQTGIPAGIRAVPVFVNPRNPAQLQHIAQLIDQGQVKVTVEQVFPLAEAARAQTESQP